MVVTWQSTKSAMECLSYQKDNGCADDANWWGAAPLSVSFRYVLALSALFDAC